MRLTTLVSRYRRLLAAAFAAAAVAFALSALRPAAPAGVQVLTAARDLPSGATLRPSDVRPVTMPAAAVPDGAVRSGPSGRVLGGLPGRVLAGAVRRGEPLTDARLTGRGLLAGLGHDLVAVPIRMADAGSVRLLHPGDHIEVLATPAALEDAETARRARSVVSSVVVIAVPRKAEDEAGDLGQSDEPGTDALIVVATHRDQAAALAGAATEAKLSFSILPASSEGA